jgi:hypothetical protein
MVMTNSLDLLIPYIVAGLTRAQKRSLRWLPAEGSATPPDRQTLLSLQTLRSTQIDKDVAVRLVVSVTDSTARPDVIRDGIWSLTPLGQRVRAWMEHGGPY